MEKGYKAWGSELTTEVSLVEADMLRFARPSGGYLGSEAVEKKKKVGASLHLVYCEVDTNVDPIGNEPVYDGVTIIGVTTSGAYGHCVEKCLAFAYVDSAFKSPGTSIEISILGDKRKAIVLDVSAWDPDNKRLQS